MKTVILDTDFIINAAKNHIDLETSIKPLFLSKIEIAYLDKTLEELEGKPLENIAKKTIEKFKKIETNQKKSVDDLILEFIKERKDVIIATQDKKLKEKLKKAKIQTMTIRQQRYVIF